MAELLTCPFCGGNNLQIRDNGIGDYFVICYADEPEDDACGASTSEVRCESREQAIERWNRRGPEASSRDIDAAYWARPENADEARRLGFAPPLGDVGELVTAMRGSLVMIIGDGTFDSGKRGASTSIRFEGPGALDRAHRLADALERLALLVGGDFSSLPPAELPPMWRPTHRHVKRGTDYEVIAEGRFQIVDLDQPLDDVPVTIYRAKNGQWWARTSSEFNDGRFEPLPPPTEPAALSDGGV